MVDQDTTTKAFIGLPIEQLIVAPIIGAAKGQRALSQVTLDFVEEMAFKPEDGGGDGSTREANLINVTLDRLVNSSTSGEVTSAKQTIQMPLLPLVTIPNFAMSTMQIHFDMEVGQSTTDVKGGESSTDSKATASGGYSGFGASFHASASVTGHVAAHHSNTRNTDFSAKYTIDASAAQLPPSEGMAKFTQILASVIQPISAEQKDDNA